MIVTAGSTNVSAYFYIVQDASNASPGEPVTGLLFSDIETGGSASYARQGAARVDLTLITQTAAGAHADGGFVLVDDTNMPGLYRCDFPDAAFATGVDEVFCQVVVASGKNAVTVPIRVELTDMDLRDAVRGGMTALPSAAADAAGGLAISDAGGLDLDARLDAAITSRLAPTVAARTLDIAADGAIEVVDLLTGHTAQTGDSFTRLGAPVGASISADVAVVDGNVDTLITRITSTIFAGITSLAEWLGLLAGKQAGDATARTEMRASGAGSGTFDETTDSVEAIRDTAPLGTAMRGTDSAALASVLGASVGADISADVAAVKVDTAATLADTTVIGAAGAGLTNLPWNAAWDAEVQSEVNDALDTAITELSQGKPTATPTLRTAIMLLYMALRNRLDVTTSGSPDVLALYNDAGTIIAKKQLTDDGSDYSEAEIETGP